MNNSNLQEESFLEEQRILLESLCKKDSNFNNFSFDEEIDDILKQSLEEYDSLELLKKAHQNSSPFMSKDISPPQQNNNFRNLKSETKLDLHKEMKDLQELERRLEIEKQNEELEKAKLQDNRSFFQDEFKEYQKQYTRIMRLKKYSNTVSESDNTLLEGYEEKFGSLE